MVAPTFAQSEFVIAQGSVALSEGHHCNQCPLSPDALAEFWRGEAAGEFAFASTNVGDGSAGG